MFGKLMKYELRYLIRIFAPMWVVVLALCGLSRLTLHPDMDGMMYVEGSEAILPVVIMMVTVFAIITMIIVAGVVLLQRFYKGMYGDEGYLMFTLPVTTGSLIHSKALSALLMMLATVVFTVIGVLIMVSYPQLWDSADLEFSGMFRMLLDMNGLTGVQFAAMAFWTVVLGILSVAEGIYLIYLAISIGQLWRKHPVAGAVGAYYVLTLAINFILGGFGATNADRFVERFAANMEAGAAYTASMIAATLCCLIVIAVSTLGNKLLLDKKLNLA